MKSTLSGAGKIIAWTHGELTAHTAEHTRSSTKANMARHSLLPPGVLQGRQTHALVVGNVRAVITQSRANMQTPSPLEMFSHARALWRDGREERHTVAEHHTHITFICVAECLEKIC